MLNVNLIEVIQNAVNEICKITYAKDSCPPTFTVSVYQGFTDKNYSGIIDKHEIILTIEHMGVVMSTPLFPRLDYQFGYENLSDEMKNLYNLTM